MDFMTTTIFSGILYDCFKTGISLSIPTLKEKLQNWVVDDAVVEKLYESVSTLKLEELGERAIEKRLSTNQSVQECLKQIVSNQTIGSVQQNHTGSGDNVAGNKTVYR